ncbi:hypothetical protein [Salmonella enterica]
MKRKKGGEKKKKIGKGSTKKNRKERKEKRKYSRGAGTELREGKVLEDC